MFDDCCPECGHLLPDSNTDCMECGRSYDYGPVCLKIVLPHLSDGADDSMESDMGDFLADFD